MLLIFTMRNFIYIKISWFTIKQKIIALYHTSSDLSCVFFQPQNPPYCHSFFVSKKDEPFLTRPFCFVYAYFFACLTVIHFQPYTAILHAEILDVVQIESLPFKASDRTCHCCFWIFKRDFIYSPAHASSLAKHLN